MRPWIPESIAHLILRFLPVPTFEQLWYFPNAEGKSGG